MDPRNYIEPKWRTLVVAAVALAYPIGQTGFELGAYGELFSIISSRPGSRSLQH